MIRRPPRSTLSSSSAASDVYKRQVVQLVGGCVPHTDRMSALCVCAEWREALESDVIPARRVLYQVFTGRRKAHLAGFPRALREDPNFSVALRTVLRISVDPEVQQRWRDSLMGGHGNTTVQEVSRARIYRIGETKVNFG
eukprot:TRINITY_DN18979_c0_g1_i2.p2 TRINITY_DN18979_c0_g1~~TRINITY_DN18979_c0_g1_i2.p2  ORF type:complete len:140 (+),score=28.10 TRINITY_DN18979_c0_g1_i2:58-477(+)